MKREQQAHTIRQTFRKNLGAKLSAKVGKVRMEDISLDIADIKEQAGWRNDHHEKERLKEKVLCIPALAALDYGALRLSKKSEADVHAALWATLQKTFPAMRLKP